MQRLPRTVGQHNISRLNVVPVLPWLHFPVHLMGVVFVLKERDSRSSHVVVQIVDIVDERGAAFAELELVAVICVVFRFALVVQLPVHNSTFQRCHCLAVGRHEVKRLCLNFLGGNMKVRKASSIHARAKTFAEASVSLKLSCECLHFSGQFFVPDFLLGQFSLQCRMVGLHTTNGLLSSHVLVDLLFQSCYLSGQVTGLGLLVLQAFIKNMLLVALFLFSQLVLGKFISGYFQLLHQDFSFLLFVGESFLQ